MYHPTDSLPRKPSELDLFDGKCLTISRHVTRYCHQPAALVEEAFKRLKSRGVHALRKLSPRSKLQWQGYCFDICRKEANGKKKSKYESLASRKVRVSS